MRIIQSDDAVGGITTWNAKTGRYVLDSNTPGWQNIETRGCVIIETQKHGLVALLPIGMSQASSVNFEDTVPQESNSTYRHVLMGEEYGKLTVRR